MVDTLIPRPLRRRILGFTIVELIATLLVMAILATLGAFGWRGFVEQSRDRVQVSNLAQFGRQAVISYAAVNGQGGWKPALETTASELRWSAAMPQESAAVQQLVLVEDNQLTSSAGYATDPLTISYSIQDDVVGLASVSSSGNCVLALVTTSGVTDAWSTGENLGTGGCVGSLAFDGPQDPSYYADRAQTAEEYGIPASPTDLVVTNEAEQVTLSWTASTSTDVVEYKIYRDNTLIDTIPATETSYVDTTVQSATGYVYTVVAVDQAGYSSLVSQQANALTLPAAITSCTSTVTVDSITLNWAPLSGTVSGYKVYLDGAVASTIPGATITLPGLETGRTYDIAVRGYNTSGLGAESCARSLTPVDAPAAPAGLTTTPDDAAVTVTWLAVEGTAAKPVTGYRVFWLNPSTGLLEQVYMGAALTYTHTGLTNGTEYSYQVATYGSGGQGLLSSAVTATPIAAPATPTLDGVTFNNGSVVVGFTVSSTTAAPVQTLEARVDGVTVATLAVDADEYTFTGLEGGVEYTLAIVASNTTGSATLNTSQSAALKPAAPTLLNANVNTTSGSKADLSWTMPENTTAAPVSGARVLWLNPVTDLWEQMAQLPGNVSSYTASGLTAGELASFRVAAYGKAGQSDSSNTATVTPVNRPVSVTPDYEIAGSGQIRVYWTAPTASAAAPVTGYNVYRDDVLVTTITGTSYTFTGLTGGTSYEFSVAPYNAAGEPTGTRPTLTVIAVVTPPTPTGLSVAIDADAATRLNVSWNALTSTDGQPVSGYRVEFLNPVTDLYEQVYQGTSASTAITGLTAGESYLVRVASYASGSKFYSSIQSPWSTSIAATPIDRPASVTATSAKITGSAEVQVSWTAPTATAAQPRTGFNVYADGVLAATVGASATTADLTGLATGSPVTFRVMPYNAAGEPKTVASEAEVTITPVLVPPTPTGLAVNPNTTVSTRLNASWDAIVGTDAQPVSGYRVSFLNPVTGLWEQAYQGTNASAGITGLTAGVEYQVRVASYSNGADYFAAIQSPWSTAVSATPIGLPAAPGSLTLTKTTPSSSLDISWTVTSTAAAPVTSVYYQVLNGATVVASGSLAADATSVTATNLPQGPELTVEVYTRNGLYSLDATKQSKSSDTIQLITKPGQSAFLGFSPKDSAIDATWSALESTELAPISGYRFFMINPTTGLREVYYQGAGTSATADGLTNGTSYTFYVAAYNSAGEGDSDSQTAIPFGAPVAATGLSVTVGSTLADLSWSAITNSAAAPVTSIKVLRCEGATCTEVTTITDTTTTSFRDTGLTNGTTYTYKLQLFNSLYSTTSDASPEAVPYGPPGTAPTLSADIPYGTNASSSASGTLSWTTVTPAAGAPATNYRVEQLNDTTGLYEQIYQGTGTSQSLSSLVFGREYKWKAYAFNYALDGSVNLGPSSSVLAFTPAKPPTAPTGVSIVDLGGGTISISFTGSSSNNGAAISAYIATCTPTTGTTITASAASSPISVTGLELNYNNAGPTYTCVVQARNAAGDSTSTAAANNPYNHYSHYAHYSYGHYGHYGYSHYGHYGYGHYGHYGYGHYGHYGYAHYAHYRYAHYAHYRYAHYRFSCTPRCIT